MPNIISPHLLGHLFEQYPIAGAVTLGRNDRYTIWRYDQQGNELRIFIEPTGLDYEEKRTRQTQTQEIQS